MNRQLTGPLCPNDGLPMSLSYFDGDENNPAVWYCDGPNDRTTLPGCFTTMPAEPHMPTLTRSRPPVPINAVVDHEAGTVTVAVTFKWDREALAMDKCEVAGFLGDMRRGIVQWLLNPASGWGTDDHCDKPVITGFEYQCYEPNEESHLGRINDYEHPICAGCGQPAVALSYAPWYGHADVNDTLTCNHFAAEPDDGILVHFRNAFAVDLSKEERL